MYTVDASKRLSVPAHRSADAMTDILTVEQLRGLFQEGRRAARQRILGEGATIMASGHVETEAGAVLTTPIVLDFVASKAFRDAVRHAEKKLPCVKKKREGTNCITDTSS